MRQAQARKDYVAKHPNRSRAIKNAILNQKVAIGMTADEVELSLGAPEDGGKKITDEDVSIMWTYDDLSIILKNGVVVEVLTGTFR